MLASGTYIHVMVRFGSGCVSACLLRWLASRFCVTLLVLRQPVQLLVVGGCAGVVSLAWIANVSLFHCFTFVVALALSVWPGLPSFGLLPCSELIDTRALCI